MGTGGVVLLGSFASDILLRNLFLFVMSLYLFRESFTSIWIRALTIDAWISVCQGLSLLHEQSLLSPNIFGTF